LEADDVELGEAVGVGVADVKSEDAPTCKNQEKKEKYGWKARVNNKLGADSKKCTGANLYKERPHGMWARRDEHFKEKSLGVVPKKQGSGYWPSKGLASVDETSFPLQAHHLIPKNYLPKHDVCVWLCKKWKKNDEYQLVEDAPYNTDHANNGYAMPYATPLKEWKRAKNDRDKTAVAFRVMAQTGVQLHQGSHAAELDPAKVKADILAGKFPIVSPASPRGDSDDFEEAEVHDAGYLNQIGEFLNAAAARIEEHVAECAQGCKKGESDGGKLEVRPLLDAVRLMNRVSFIAKVFLQTNIIFACPYGMAYAVTRHLLKWDGRRRKYYIQKETDKGVEDLTIADLEQALEAREG
jgi:hypothetical protein